MTISSLINSESLCVFKIRTHAQDFYALKVTDDENIHTLYKLSYSRFVDRPETFNQICFPERWCGTKWSI